MFIYLFKTLKPIKQSEKGVTLFGWNTHTSNIFNQWWVLNKDGSEAKKAGDHYASSSGMATVN